MTADLTSPGDLVRHRLRSRGLEGDAFKVVDHLISQAEADADAAVRDFYIGLSQGMAKAAAEGEPLPDGGWEAVARIARMATTELFGPVVGADQVATILDSLPVSALRVLDIMDGVLERAAQGGPDPEPPEAA